MTGLDRLILWMAFLLALTANIGIGRARADELRDMFARVQDKKAEACWGPKWARPTDRGAEASLNFGAFITNENPIMCDALAGIRCNPFECFFVGTLFIGDDGKTLWYAAPRKVYPPNIHVIGMDP